MTYKTKKRTTTTSQNATRPRSIKEIFKPIKPNKKSTHSSLKENQVKRLSQQASTPKQVTTKSSSNLSTVESSIKRNLFGIRLNHDQLNRDLKEMWKEQIEKQKLQWNFDFEKLRPVGARHSKSLNQNISLPEVSNRYEWIKVNTYYGPNLQSISLPTHLLDSSLVSSDMAVSAFDKEEIDYEHSLHQKSQQEESYDEELSEEEEEEEDDALAVPQFYKFQRRHKLNENQSRLNISNFSPVRSSSMLQNSFSKSEDKEQKENKTKRGKKQKVVKCSLWRKDN